jgi:Tfp pilus assembly ATPase PilU
VASEVFINTDRARAALAGESDAPPLREAIIDGGYFGMRSLDQSLLKLHQRELVSFQDALANANDPSDFKLAVQAMGLRSA